MTRFLDGPAKGKHLMIHRTPTFLRVVIAAGVVDALDQPDDTPELIEEIHVYQTDGPSGHCHVNMGRKGGGFYPICDYRLCEKQPTDAEARNSVKWSKWCEDEDERQMIESKQPDYRKPE